MSKNSFVRRAERCVSQCDVVMLFAPMVRWFELIKNNKDMMNNLQSSAFVAKTTQLLLSVARLRLLLVMLLTLTASTAWGATAEFAPTNFSGQGTSGTGSAISATVNGVTFACDKGYGTTQIRCYSGSTITISSSNTITAISFTFSENKYTGGLATSYTNLNTNSWEMALSSQARITKCVVTYEEASADPYTVTLEAGSGSVTDTELTETSAGEGVTLPTPTLNGCDEWSFAGWATSAVATETSSKPATLLTGTYKPTANTTLYAVYQRTEETEGNGGTENVSRSYTFSQYTAGAQYAEGEEHELDDVLTLTTTQCHFTSELRIYSSDTHNGYVVSNQLPGRIISIGFNAGNKVDKIAVYGSTNGTAWTEVGQVSVTSTSYANYSLSFGETNYTYFKLDVVGSNQVRLKSITITWESTSAGGTTTTTYYHSTPDCTTETAVTLNPNGGTISDSDWTLENGVYKLTTEDESINLPTITRTGYTFGGWATSASGTKVYDDTETINDLDGTAVNLYAIWTANKYDIIYKDQGNVTFSGTHDTGYPTQHTYGTETTLKGATKTGYTFDGWYKEAACTNIVTTLGATEYTGTITLYAKWTANKYDITYKDQGDVAFSGTHETGYPTQHTYGTETTLKGATKTGYTFDGWYKEAACTNIVTTLGATEYTGTITLYAKWTANKYDITYKDQGDVAFSGTHETGYPTQHTYGTETTLKGATKTGYTFDGWYKEAACTNIVTTLGATDYTGNITLYAKWTEKNLTRYRTDCDACIPLDGYAEINGTYHFFPGETITLTVTPPANDVPYTYQWQKFVVDKWEDINGETNVTYTKDEATIEDVGHYRCVVSAEGYCDLTPEFDVKCLQLYVYYDNKSDVFNTPLNRGAEENTATISVDLQNANYKYYFKITDGCGNWYGFDGDIHSGWCTDVPMNVNEYCGLQTTKFGTYVFNVNYSDLAHLTVSVIYPAALQEAGKEIYLDNNVLNWTHSNNADGKNKIYYRIGRNDHNNKIAMTLVPGTAALYKVTTTKYDNFDVWHIANNGCWSDNNSIYKTNTEDEWAATQATAFETLPVTLDAITVTPTTLRSVGGEDRNNNCEFYNYDITEGMKKHKATVIPATGGTITVSYTDYDGTAKSDFTSGDRDLAHTCLLTITATPDAGYSGALTVNGESFTSGNVHTLAEDAVIKVVWAEKATPTFEWSATTCTAALEADNTFPTLNNPNSLSVTYTSSDENVAKIDANGNIVLGSEGRTTITAIGAESATHKSATDTYELIVVESNCRWVETDIADIQPTDEVLVTMTTLNGTYTLDHSKEASDYPPAIAITVNGNEAKYTASHKTSIWNISGNATDGYVFYPNGDTSKWLYCTSTQYNVKVGTYGKTDDNYFFTIENNYLKNKKWNVYIGVYNSSDWRHYPAYTGNAIAGQTLKFYKRECLDSEHYWVTWDANGGQWTDGSTKKLESYAVGADINQPADPSREGYRFDGWEPTPTTMPAQNTTFTAVWTKVYKVIWYNGNGEVHKEEIVVENNNATFPTTNPEPCDLEYPHFIGWTADPIVGSTTTQPELVEDVKVTGDCDYYAVFAKGEGGSSDYKLVTSDPADWSGTYLIVNTDDKKAWKGSATSDNGAIDVTITNNTITSNATTDNETFTIATMTGGYSIKGTSGKYISGTSGNNATNYKDEAQLNTISIDNDNNVTITSNTSVLRQNNSNASLFRYYKSSSYSSQHPIQLYKKGSGVNYTSYITTCCTSWTAPTLTYTTPLNAETSQTAQPQWGSGTTYGDYTYTSSNPSVLAVHETTGEVTAVSKGTATITVTWEGNETYCSVSATSNTITVNGSYSVTFHSNGGTGTMEPQKADPSTQCIAKLNKNEFTKAGYVFVGWKDASSVAYTDEQENITLTKNITLFAQWAPVVTLNDAGSEETLNPTAVGGTVTLPNEGANACSPYEFVGWTSVAIADWNEGIKEPALVASPYKPTAPITLYAVYKIQSKGNSNAFKLSFEVSGTTYYVGSINSDPYIKGFSNITADNAVTFYKEKIENNTEKYWVYFEKYDSYYDETTKEYLYLYNGNDINTTNSPSETQGWIFITLSNGLVQFKDITYDKYFSFTDGGNLTDHSAGSQKSFNLLPAVSSTYYAIPDCDKEIKITFETGNGNFVANTPDENPLVVTPGETITLPICEYPGDGIEFIGWLKNTPQEELSDVIADGYYEGGEEYVVEDTRDVIFYAYYKVTPEEVEFTGQDDAELKIYHYNGVDNYYYANTFVDEHAELAGIERCFDATTWKFTNVGNMQYYIQDETGKYLGAVSDSDNDFSLSNTPKIWNFTLIDGLWRMICEDSPSRALMYMSTGKCFRNAALSNISNSAYSYVTLGICPDDGYTTNPVLSQGFSITNTAMVTSASGQKVKAASALTLETRNIELPCKFTITAPNITFYDNTGAEVTELESSAASEQFELHFAYKPTAENTMEFPTITIVDDELKTYTIKNRIQARSLPNTFAIVAKVGNIWYALPSQGLNSTTPPAAYPVEVDDMADPTAVTAVPANADWSLRQVYEASRSDATHDRYVANGDNLVFVNNASPAMALNASSSGNYLLTDAQYTNYYQTNPGLYEWTPTTTDLETYQLTNEQRSIHLSVNIATVFGVHAQDKAVEQVRFLPIRNRYTQAPLQVVEWKENSVVVMYNGDPAQTASVSVYGGTAQTTTLSSAQRDIAVYELAATGLASNPTQPLNITIGSEKIILSIPYIISGTKKDIDVLPGSTVAARQEVAKVADLVVLNGATLTADGAKGNPYKFRNVTIYGGGKLVIPSEAKGFGVASLTLRAGGITDAGEYDYVYPQFELRGTFTNSVPKINYDYITDYDHWYHLVLPFAGDLGTIKYPTEFYGANVATNNTGSWQIKRYAGEIRATGNYNAWKDIETEGETTTTAGKGYIFWGAPKKVTVNGATTRQKWGIQRITMSIKAGDAMTAEAGDKTITDLGSYANVSNNSGAVNDQGWNLIGNPYMVNLTTMSKDGLKAGKLVEEMVDGKWTGKWENNGDNLRYLTIPSDHFDTYEAKTVSAAINADALVPGRAFFVQLEGEANGVTFATANRASLMPALRAAYDKPVDIETGIVLSNETLQDEVNFWIKDGKTNDYEYNADYPKTPNTNNFNIYGVHTNGHLSWVATGPEYAEESMPIGYQVPAAGTYMLSISETYDSDLLDALYVTDHALSPEVTVDIMSESYEFSVNQAETNNERFTVSVKVKEMTESGTTGVDNVGTGDEQIHKFIYQDKIYILHHGVIYDATGKRVITINK